MAKSGLTLGIPLTSWNTLAPRLKDDRIIETGRSVGRRVIVSRGWLQAAAAILLLAGGTVFGRLTAGVPVWLSRDAGPTLAPFTADSAPTFRNVAEAQAVASRSQNGYQASMAFIPSRDSSSLATSSPAAIKTRLPPPDPVSHS